MGQVKIESGSYIIQGDRNFHVNPTPLTYKRRSREGLDPSNHNTSTHTGRRVFIHKKVRTCINPHIPRVSLFITFVSTPTLKSSHKSTTIIGEHACVRRRRGEREEEDGGELVPPACSRSRSARCPRAIFYARFSCVTTWSARAAFLRFIGVLAANVVVLALLDRVAASIGLKGLPGGDHCNVYMGIMRF
jgi:hypothetical protein